MTIANPQRDYLSSFGRNRGRTLRPVPQALIDNLLPKIAVDLNNPLFPYAPPFNSPLEGESKPATQVLVGGEGGAKNSAVSVAAEAHPPHQIREGADLAPPQRGSFSRIALEIGFGGGEHLLMQAERYPDTLFIGCEPFINGVAKCLAGIEAKNLTNIRLFTHDARELLKALPDASLDTAFILFPDPWPKARHNKRRLVNAETLSMLARTQKRGGRLLIATDHVDYSVWILEVLLVHPDYTWTAQAQADWQTPPVEWTETKYQRKTSAEGRAPQFFECVRN